MRKLFEEKAVCFDGHLQPANTEWYYDFAAEALAECHNILDWEKWYVDVYVEANRTIIMKNIDKPNCNIYIQILADPEDDFGDIWLVFDLWIDEPHKFYSFILNKN